MAELRYARIVPLSTSANVIREIKIEDAPGGLGWEKIRVKPIFARRVQSGALVTQIPRYNKRGYRMTITLWEPDIEDYFEIFYNANEPFLLEFPKIGSQVLEYSGFVHILAFGTGYDFNNNLRTLDLEVQEV